MFNVAVAVLGWRRLQSQLFVLAMLLFVCGCAKEPAE
jgi:hypothetical protein